MTTQPPIEYIQPTSRAFAGMKWILFQPFDIGKWFALGFTAWIAGLLDGGGPNFNFNSGGGGDHGGGGPNPEEAFREVFQWLHEQIVLVVTIGVIVMLVSLVVYIVLLWVSSRGKFMLLDNVVFNRARVQIPWNQFRRHGNSLFLWRLVFALVASLVALVVIGATAGLALTIREAAIPLIIVGAVFLLAIILTCLYITVLLEDFVVPLMYRDSLTTNQAWRRLLAVHQTAVGSFILYVLWKLLLGLAAGALILVFGLATCCIGFLVMAIPYVGTVLLLPVSVFFRLLGPEFLRQFGPEYDVFPRVVEASETP